MYLERTIYKDLLEWKNNKSDKVLELKGARQVGKTYILKKFANENYKNVIYVNLIEPAGKRFIKSVEEQVLFAKSNNDWLHKIFIDYSDNFSNNENTVVIIDEIQESSVIYSLIRNFARDLQAHFIVTGSYLGKTTDKEFFKPAGDIESLTLYPLSFKEFLIAKGKIDKYNNIDLFGKSDSSDYVDLLSDYNHYLQVGGYPEVVQLYLNGKGFLKCLDKLKQLTDIFIMEFCGYLDNAVDAIIFRQALNCIVSIMVTENMGTTNLTKELHKRLNSQSVRINKGTVTKVISWLYSSGIIGYCDRINECNKFNKTYNSRLYFNDVGICHYFLRNAGVDKSTLIGILNENFVYLALKKKIERFELVGDTPCFGTYKGGEIDFLASGYFNNKSFGIEVKSGRNAGKTANSLLQDGKIDLLYLLKGNTVGGKHDNILTVPIWLTDRICFDDGAQDLIL